MDDPNPESAEASSDAKLAEEFAEWLPKKGDRLFVRSLGGAHLDPLGMTAPGEPRNLTGRWRLYASGFLMAADELVRGWKGLAYQDELVYPILFLYRHHLELQLKYVIRCCPACDDELREWMTKRHSLLAILEKLAEVYPRFSEWCSPECTAACKELVEEFDAHDPVSQSSRYPIDGKGNQTLTSLDVIDLTAVRRGVHKISHYFDAVIEQIHEDRESEWEAEISW